MNLTTLVSKILVSLFMYRDSNRTVQSLSVSLINNTEQDSEQNSCLEKHRNSDTTLQLFGDMFNKWSHILNCYSLNNVTKPMSEFMYSPSFSNWTQVCRAKVVWNYAKPKPLQQRQDAKSLTYLDQTRTNRIPCQSPSCDLQHLRGMMGAVCVFTADTLA